MADKKITDLTVAGDIHPDSVIEVAYWNGSAFVSRQVVAKNILADDAADFFVGNFTGFQSLVNSSPAKIYLSNSVHGATYGVVLLGANSGDVVINPQRIIQIGQTGIGGNDIYFTYSAVPTAPLPLGFSHPVKLRCKAYNGGALTDKWPGIVGFAAANDASELGQLRFYSRTPFWNAGNNDGSSPNTAGTEIMRAGPAGLIMTTGIPVEADKVKGNTHLMLGSVADGAGQSWGMDNSAGVLNALRLGGVISTDVRTTATDKITGIVLYPNVNTDPEILAIGMRTNGAYGELNIGGGSSAKAAFNTVNFYIGSSSTVNGPGTLSFQVGDGWCAIPQTLYVAGTVTAAATTGAQTINKTCGTVNFAAAATSLVVTNNKVTVNSIVQCVIRTNDATAIIKNVVPANGSFTINLDAAATAETSVGFFVINPN